MSDWTITYGPDSGPSIRVGGIEISDLVSGISIDMGPETKPRVVAEIAGHDIAKLVVRVDAAAVVALAGGAAAVVKAWVDGLTADEIEPALLAVEEGLGQRVGDRVIAALTSLLPEPDRDV